MHTIFSRRSIRSYTGEMPTDEELGLILKAVYASPVGMGRYDSLHVTVVKNSAYLTRLEAAAGAQLASQYAAIATNPSYASLFEMVVPEISIKSLGLNCGIYDLRSQAEGKRKGLALDYLGREIKADDPRLLVLEAVTADYPPAFITTACHDFLRQEAEPMYNHLVEKAQCLINQCLMTSCEGVERSRKKCNSFHISYKGR
mgnify:CR=1 FL=1